MFLNQNSEIAIKEDTFIYSCDLCHRIIRLFNDKNQKCKENEDEATNFLRKIKIDMISKLQKEIFECYLNIFGCHLPNISNLNKIKFPLLYGTQKRNFFNKHFYGYTPIKDSLKLQRIPEDLKQKYYGRLVSLRSISSEKNIQNSSKNTSSAFFSIKNKNGKTPNFFTQKSKIENIFRFTNTSNKVNDDLNKFNFI